MTEITSDQRPHKQTRFPPASHSMLNVNTLIIADRRSRGPLRDVKEQVDAGTHGQVDLADALQTVLKAVVRDPEWAAVLNPAFHVPQHCETA
ncbi:MAG TPA: hypothetical protein VGO47_11155, partial [Chlamydiales bacterium]|nr:hypothetical protein [Chlamydiales bacterium]